MFNDAILIENSSCFSASNILYSGVWLGYNEYLHKKDKKMMKESEVKGHGE